MLLNNYTTITYAVCVCVYLYDAQCVVQVFADFLFLLLLFLLVLGGVLEAFVVDAEAEEDLHGAEAVVEVAETHLVETWTDTRQVRTTELAACDDTQVTLIDGGQTPCPHLI